MRGLRSETAHHRQMAGSRFKVIKTQYKMDDAVQKAYAAAPQANQQKSNPNGTPPPILKKDNPDTSSPTPSEADLLSSFSLDSLPKEPPPKLNLDELSNS